MGSISNRLRLFTVEERPGKLKSELSQLNKKLLETPGIYIPLVSSSHPHCCVVNIPPEESVLLNSRERAPFLIIAEVLESSYLNSSEQLHEYTKEYHKVFEIALERYNQQTPKKKIKEKSHQRKTTNKAH